MDSCNSGSMSSSGGDDEYDSRAESSISAFLNHNNNNHPLTHVGPMSNPTPPQPPPPPSGHHHQIHHSMFDPLSNYFDPLSSSSSSRSLPLSTNPNSLLNLDMVWSTKNLRSDTSCTDLGGFIASSSSPTQQYFTNQRPSFNPSIQLPQVEESPSRGPVLGSASNDQQGGTTSSSSPTPNMARNPKKRSRASRRAPTTVLTTDTTNFRAMVQEFTGIPAPPFTSSPFPRSRLDLFGTSSTSLRSLPSHHNLEPSHPSYLLRPFAQKIQPPFLSSSSSSVIDAIASSTTTTTNLHNNNSTNNTTASTSSNSDLGLLKYPPNFLNINMQNPVLNFHSLLHPSPPKYPLPNSSIIGSTKPHEPGSLDIIPSNDSHLKMGALEEFGLSHGHHINTSLTGFQNLVPSSDTTLRRTDHNSTAATTSTTTNNNNSSTWGNEGGGLLRSINGNYSNSNNNNSNTNNNNNNNNNTQRGVVGENGKVNYSGSSSDFQHKGSSETTNVANNGRSEGMVESWICSSD